MLSTLQNLFVRCVGLNDLSYEQQAGVSCTVLQKACSIKHGNDHAVRNGLYNLPPVSLVGSSYLLTH